MPVRPASRAIWISHRLTCSRRSSSSARSRVGSASKCAPLESPASGIGFSHVASRTSGTGRTVTMCITRGWGTARASIPLRSASGPVTSLQVSVASTASMSAPSRCGDTRHGGSSVSRLFASRCRAMSVAALCRTTTSVSTRMCVAGPPYPPGTSSRTDASTGPGLPAGQPSGAPHHARRTMRDLLSPRRWNGFIPPVGAPPMLRLMSSRIERGMIQRVDERGYRAFSQRPPLASGATVKLRPDRRTKSTVLSEVPSAPRGR